VCRENVITKDIPSDLVGSAKEKRAELIAAIADVDDEVADIFLNEEEPTEAQLMVRYIFIHFSENPVFIPLD
jgi:translation elongation factor EF-G